MAITRETLTQQLRDLQETKLKVELKFARLPELGLRQDREGVPITNRIAGLTNQIQAKLKEIELFDFRSSFVVLEEIIPPLDITQQPTPIISTPKPTKQNNYLLKLGAIIAGVFLLG